MPPKKKTRSTRTKTDVESEFESFRTGAGDDQDPVATKLARENSARAKAAASTLTVDTVVQATTELGLSVQRALANVTEQLSAKVQELETVREAIAAETAELENLHKIDIAKTSLDMLVSEYEEKVAQFENDTAERRAMWDREKVDFANRQSEIDEKIRTNRARDEEEYNYGLSKQRQAENDKVVRETALREKNWTEREATLAARETEFATLKAQVEAFPTTLKQAVDKEVAIVANSMKRDHAHEFAILRKDYESQIALLQQRITSDNTAQTAMAHQIDRLQSQLEAAKQQVNDIATKALESASGQQALAKVTDIVNNSNNGSTTRGKS